VRPKLNYNLLGRGPKLNYNPFVSDPNLTIAQGLCDHDPNLTMGYGTTNPFASLSLAQYGTKKIKKEAFLLAFKVAFNKLIIKENICAGFRGARLVLYNLEAVILKLDVVLCTPTLLKLEDTL
jgi:hypothetical protein